MKCIKIFGSVAIAVLLTGIFVSCEKTFDDKLVTDQDLDNSAIVQVYNAMVNSARNYVYVDGKPVTGALLISGSVFPALNTGIGFKVSGGLRDFLVLDTLRTSTQLPLSFAENLEANKFYTIFMYDTITSPKQKTVLTNIELPTDTSVRLRFANFIYNPTTVPAIDVFSFNKGANLFTNIPVTGVTDFIPYPSQMLDTLYIRETGSLTNILKVTIFPGTDPTFRPRRSYTLVYRGSHRGTRLASIFPNY